MHWFAPQSHILDLSFQRGRDVSRGIRIFTRWDTSLFFFLSWVIKVQVSGLLLILLNLPFLICHKVQIFQHPVPDAMVLYDGLHYYEQKTLKTASVNKYFDHYVFLSGSLLVVQLYGVVDFHIQFLWEITILIIFLQNHVLSRRKSFSGTQKYSTNKDHTIEKPPFYFDLSHIL